MDIPHGSISNASIWGAPVWVPAALLSAAAGAPSPDLMYHLRTTLDTIVNDPEGLLNKQVGGGAKVVREVLRRWEQREDSTLGGVLC
jgi:hypothetical protein